MAPTEQVSLVLADEDMDGPRIVPFAEGRAAVAESEESAVGDTVQELVLEDGRRLGHRSLARYYKQSVRPQELATHEMIDNLIASYRSMGHQIVS